MAPSAEHRDIPVPPQRTHDHTSQLPDEILEIIIRGTGPCYGTAASSTEFKEKRNWVSCGSVCRRWHRIALPHIFRYVRVAPLDLIDTTKDRTASRFNIFLQENPSIAPLIQEINFLRLRVDFKVLRSILGALQNLQYFVFHRSLVEGIPNPKDPPMTFKIHRLLHTGGACDLYDDCYPSNCRMQVPILLSLFSEIGEFENMQSCEHDSEPLFKANHDDEAVRIHSLKIGAFPNSVPYFNIMHQLHLFNHLSCLRITLLSLLNFSAEATNGFLVAVCGTLKELYLRITHRIDNSMSDVSIPTTDFCPQLSASIASTLRTGLTACSSLHGFRLELGLVHYTSVLDEQSLRRSLNLGFLIGIELLKSLNTSELRHLSFRYQLSFNGHCAPADVRTLDFTRLRYVLDPFINLRSVTLDFYDGPNELGATAEFMRCARDELRGFKGALYHRELGSFLRCDEPSCAWSSHGRLNAFLSLERDVLKSYWAEH
ncbi:hypothetical protein BDY19DRAFT_971298 [Irpex rosettiformis]|uniref:Uncharacterized protein n=1 Tax=Irpex rosettiformis TaxID=378272 RepID=A0ACB8TQZ9_9APHY|nr:hypothetical protein BDY19DRAFT_971298 [Irpex rosettiformis]